MKNIIKFAALTVVAAIMLTGCGAKNVKNESGVTSFKEAGIEAEVVGHRGGSTDAPENTLSAFKSCIEKGYYAAECDIMLTSDNRWVITHDDKVKKHFEGKGNISKMTFEQVRDLKYTTDVEGYENEVIPSLEEYLDLFSGTATRPQIELKCTDTEHLDDVIKALEVRGLLTKSIIISFHIDQLKMIHESNPEIELWYLVSNKITEKDIEAAKSAGCKALSVNYSKNTEESIKLAVDSGLEVAVWTIDDIETAKAYCEYGAAYVVSNKLVK